MLRRLRIAATNILILGSATALSLLLCEILIRTLLPRFDPSGRVTLYQSSDQPDLYLGPRNAQLRMTKNAGDYDVSVSFNALGLRESKDYYGSDPSSYFVVGDSFSFGWGVEEDDRYSNVLQSILRVPVYNISAPSANLRSYGTLIRYAARHGAHIRRIVVGVCMENDLANYDQGDPPVVYGATNGTPDVKSRLSHLLNIAKNKLAHDSAIYLALTTVVHQSASLRALAVRHGLITDNLAGMYRNEYFQPAIDSSVALLRHLDEQFETIVVIVPSRGLWVGPNRQEEDRVHTAFVASLRAAGVSVLDLRPVMESSADPLQFHFRNDGHWNREGHRLAAQQIARFIMETPSIGGASH